MPTTLSPMRREVFARFAAEASEAYARDNALCGRWAAEDALANATAEFGQLLPQGIDTADHFFYEVLDAAAGSVGCVWFGLIGSGASRTGHVYNIRIRPSEQRKGHGRAALLALESIAADMQVSAIRLNVFAHNPGAQALYQSLRYQVTSSSMRKALRT